MAEHADFSPLKQPTYYELLGCSQLSNTDQILKEYKIRALELHPDKQGQNTDNDDKFKLLQQAKEVLCDEKLRADYDRWLRSGLAISFNDWTSQALTATMHWATKATETPALNSAQTPPEDKTQHLTPQEIIKKFRNYEI